MEGGEERISYWEGEVILVQFHQSRAERQGVTKADGKGISLILKPPDQLSHQERKHLYRIE